MPRFRFHGELNDLLPPSLRPPSLRGGYFERSCASDATLKHAIEALGVPHTEVGRVLVDGRPACLDRRVCDMDAIDVHPAPPIDAGPDAAGAPAPSFLADAHLGRLARRLRLLGFDTALAGDAPDRALAAQAEAEERILLTRDRELLMHRRVVHGRYLRAQRTEDQLRDVVGRFGLRGRARPFTRCLECNGILRRADFSELADRLPPFVAATQSEFTVCTRCGRAYWPGSHWRRLKAIVDALGSG